MSTKQESFDRLRAEGWISAKPQLAAMNDATAKYQSLSEGSGTYVYDEYSVIITGMPADLPAEAYLLEFARDPNGAVGNGLFNAINVFTKRTSTDPQPGDIYDIDIKGPDNGSIVLVDLSAGFGMSTQDSWFDIQTISCDRYGSHPENGAREFGFEYVAGGVKFYTRGVSRPGNWALRLGGAIPQMMGWTALMKGISTTVKARGGTPKANSFRMEKFTKAN